MFKNWSTVMLKRFLIVRDLTGYNAINLSVEGLNGTKIVSNVGRLALAVKAPTTFDEIKNIVDLPVIFSGATEEEFRNHTEIEKRISDPNGLFDDVFSYHLIDYLLIDLVEKKLVFPDYEQFEPDCNYFPVIEESFESFYSAYSYSTSNRTDPDNVFQYSIENKMVFVEVGTVESIFNSVVKRSYLLQSIDAGASPELFTFCCSCNEFNCDCTDEQLEAYSLDLDNLPF